MHATRYHVHPAGDDNNTGLTWTDAFASVQRGINADNATEVWVAEGVYTPTEQVYDNGTRNYAFYLRDNVAVYGGFADSGSPAWDDRDWILHQTILSGDLDNDDNDTNANGIIEPTLGEAIIGDNSYHVVFNYCPQSSLSAGAILDGVVVTAGSADNEFPHVRGGGINNVQDAHPTIRNCTLIGNYGARGGAICNQSGARPTIISCRFESNSSERGGAICNILQSSATIQECLFRGNNATSNGGAITNIESSVTILRSTFDNNTTGGLGGAVFNEACEPLIRNCTLVGNQAKTGGGIFNQTASPLVTNCTITGNRALEPGAGIRNDNASSPRITNCILWNNTTTGTAYASDPWEIQTTHGAPVISHCIVQDNETGDNSTCIAILTDDPNLDGNGLQDNGGNVPTIALLTPTPAEDAGADNASAPTGVIIPEIDARGMLRDSVADIGSYELDTSQTCTDDDGDGYYIQSACGPVDCNDNDAAIHPGATELCDGIDNDCDNQTDESLSRTCETACGTGTETCSDGAWVGCTAPQPEPEVCDGIDNDCDGQIDEGVQTTYYRDTDNDTYGVSDNTTLACTLPPGYSAADGDCDDTDPAVNPAAAEVCDGIDNDCDGQTDEGVQTTYYRDADGDTYGVTGSTTLACTLPPGYSAIDGDCDDTADTVYPGAEEICGDGIDQDCDGSDLSCGESIEHLPAVFNLLLLDTDNSSN